MAKSLVHDLKVISFLNRGLELMTRSADEVAKSTDNDTEASHEAGISWDKLVEVSKC